MDDMVDGLISALHPAPYALRSPGSRSAHLRAEERRSRTRPESEYRAEDGLARFPQQETALKTLTNALICASITFAAGSALAMDDMKKGDATSKDTMTMQQCKDHMAMAKKDGMKKDDAMMKKDTMCADMMKKTV